MDYLCVHYVQLVLRVFIAISFPNDIYRIVYHRFHLAGFHKTPSPVHRPRKSIEKAKPPVFCFWGGGKQPVPIPPFRAVNIPGPECIQRLDWKKSTTKNPPDHFLYRIGELELLF